MRDGLTVKVIIPALNEADSIGKVLADIPAWVSEIIVVDNGSTDATAAVAGAAGARVIDEPRRGYGQACLAGMVAADWCDIVVFLDADYSDFPQQMDRLVGPIAEDRADMVLGRRIAIAGDAQAFTPPQRFGTALACGLMRILWGGQYRDMGPFRAIRWSSLRSLNMRDTTYGWTVEMQIKALLAPLRVEEVPVDYRRRIGKSKISGTFRGVLNAGAKILGTIGKYLVSPPSLPGAKPERLTVFARWPMPGKTKTRLIPALGALRAAELQRRMTVRTLATARLWAIADRQQIEVRHEGGSWRQMRRWLGPGQDQKYRHQHSGDLGRRMAGAFAEAFDEGCRRVVLVGSDCPGVTPALLEEAFDALGDNDLVLGPTLDGGYWLIGMKRPLGVFDNIAWSTDTVLAQTLELARCDGLQVRQLATLTDIDMPEDLPGVSEFFNPKQPILSVIIPALNEASNIEAAIRSAAAEGVEIIVIDSGSSDATPQLAAELGAKVITSPPGRACQQNTGAVVAQGDILLFLHADTTLPAGYADSVFEVMLDGSVLGGGFLWRTTLDSASMRVSQFMVRLRTVYGQEPWGDQAIFVRKTDFETVGGFPNVPIAEDWDFVHALRRRGRLATVEKTVITSARRWQKIGVVRGFVTNWIIVIGCRLGIPRHLLVKLY